MGEIKSMTSIMRMTVPGKPEFLNLCSESAITVSAVLGFNVDVIDEIGMAVFEACKFLTCHESNCWCKAYNVEFFSDGGKLVVEITTNGQYSIQKSRRICMDCPNEGELGVQIIKTIMDEVEIDRQYDNGSGKKITLVKNLC